MLACLVNTTDIAVAIETLLDARAEGQTVCPSEVARALARDDGPWRPLMSAVRTAAAELAQQGRLTITRRGEKVDALSGGGPIRFGRPRCP